jgi:4-diphosphocytidyl-2-C-methyl-D-erythritol kinase
MTPLRLEAPAKLNLSLRVTGRRPDGFHELDSMMVLLELADRLLLMPGATGLRVEAPAGEPIPTGGRNLAWRGLLAGAGGEPDLACLTLDKRIPIAAGLGGGSSDAAAAWRLGRRWVGADERATDVDLAALATIGADIPFFAAQLVAARVSGIGERVSRIAPPAARLHAVLVHPAFRLRTADVFAELRAADWTAADVAADPLEPGGNDLLAPARRLRPEIGDLFRLVVSAGGVPRLTGSGPTVFALVDDEQRAAAIADRLRRAGLRVSETRLRREPASIEALTDGEEDE